VDCGSVSQSVFARWIEASQRRVATAREPAPAKDGSTHQHWNKEDEQPDFAERQPDLVVIRGEQQHPNERERANAKREP
jgi:hypothetical protein